MKNFSVAAHVSFLVMTVFSLLLIGRSLAIPAPGHLIYGEEVHNNGNEVKSPTDNKEGGKQEVGTELYPTGSSLPDCSHACGACFPCKRVMVSFKCSVAESCPTIYRCMCKGKYYHVPSN